MVDDARQWRWVRALLLPLIILAWLAVVVLAFWLLGHVTRAVIMLVLAGVIAYAITPLVNRLSTKLHRHLSLGIAYVVCFGALFAFVSFVVATAATQVTHLVQNLPRYLEMAKQLQPQALALLRPLGIGQSQLDQLRDQLIAETQQAGSSVARGAIDTVSSIAGGIVDAVLVLMLSIYLTANGPRIGAWLRRQGRAGRRRGLGLTLRVESVIAIVNRVVGGYVRGTLTLATLIGVLVGAGMQVAGLPYAILLGLLAFFMEFIPVVGTLVSGVVCVGIALTQPPWWRALIVLAYFVVIHIIEGDFIGPRVMGKAIGIHPAVALLALVAGTEVFGIWGALFGAPIAGLLQGLVVAFWRDLRPAQPRRDDTPAVG
jgi:predicted PurR-regulated permease PerM